MNTNLKLNLKNSVMMKPIFEQYASYNVWANQKMIDSILPLPEETVQRTIASSFSSLQLTLMHILQAQSIWWQRIKLVDTIQTDEYINSSMQEICTGLISQSKQWKEWIDKGTPAALEHEFIYRNSKKNNLNNRFTRCCCICLIMPRITAGNW